MHNCLLVSILSTNKLYQALQKSIKYYTSTIGHDWDISDHHSMTEMVIVHHTHTQIEPTAPALSIYTPQIPAVAPNTSTTCCPLECSNELMHTLMLAQTV